MEELICDSIPVIGSNKSCELNDIKDNAAFFTQVIRYAILSDHEHSGQFSPNLSDDLFNCTLPSVNMEFTGRKEELKQCAKLLQDNNVVFINGVAGIGKSEFAKCYARKNHKKYTNIIYMYYYGSLRQNIIQMDFADELLYELQTCGLNLSSGEDVELYKDGDYTDGLMTEHLRKLLQLGKLSNSRLDILHNLSLLPLSGVLKASFKSWLKLTDLNDVNCLVKYGFINDDSENRTISLHPLIQEVVLLETAPAVSTCRTLIDSLHLICLVHGLEVRKPMNVIDSLISVTEQIIIDEPAVFLLFLQDMFPYMEKYLVTEYLPKLVTRMECVMEEVEYSDEYTVLCDRALLLDYKAELFYVKKDYANALKKRQKAISILESLPTEKADLRTASLLSNLYNNLSNVYLMMKKPRETAESLKTAINIRHEYAHLGLIESHDMLQQMLNLSNMLV